jgi:hypothetical protein
VVVVRLILGTLHVLDIMVVVLLALHDAVDSTRRSILAAVLRATSQLPLFTLAVALIDVAASVTTTSVLVEIGA